MTPRLFIVGVVLVFFAALAPSAARVQRRGTASAKPSAACAVGALKFACPRNFAPVAGEPGDRARFFSKDEPRSVLFIGVPASGETVEEFTQGLVKLSTRKLLPDEDAPFELKEVTSLTSDAAGKSEVFKHVWLGFNGNTSVMVKLRYHVHMGRAFAIGYAYVTGRGSEATERFAQNVAGDFMPACNESLRLTRSVTGERMDVFCALVFGAPVRQ